jgi:hypothetical protein
MMYAVRHPSNRRRSIFHNLQYLEAWDWIKLGAVVALFMILVTFVLVRTAKKEG